MKYLLLFLLSTMLFVHAEVKKKSFDFQANTKIHRINYGESLARIALDNKVSVSFLLSLNEDIDDPNQILTRKQV